MTITRRSFGLGLASTGVAGATCFGFGVLLPTAATATVPEGALQAYRAGRWTAAADTISDQQDPDQLAFAARALLAGALLDNRSPGRAALVARARSLAQAATRLQGAHIEGRLQLATALGLQARLMSPPRALASGLPGQIKRILDAVITDAPNEPWAHALLGGWHLEALRIGGLPAQTMVGASVRKGKSAFARAIALNTNEPAILFYYAAALIALDPVQYVAEARALVRRVEALSAQDAFQTEIRARAIKLAQTVDRDGARKAAALAVSWL